MVPLYGAPVSVVPNDYDADPGRFRAADRSWQLRGDIHEMVVARLARDNVTPVIDVGGGRGRLAELLPGAVVVDPSPAQLADAPHPKVRADALALPFRSGVAGAVTMLWMLYHLDDPVAAIAEAKRVLRPGGRFASGTASRRNDPELTDSYPPSPFDAEEAPVIVASVFGDVEVETWDGPFTVLPDREAVVQYCRSHFLPPEAADRVTPPVTLTKRGCLMWARAPSETSKVGDGRD
jgi:SAM-dependent methyltransferase